MGSSPIELHAGRAGVHEPAKQRCEREPHSAGLLLRVGWQGGVDGAGAGDVLAGRALLERLDDLVAVPGAGAQGVEQDEAHLAAACPAAEVFQPMATRAVPMVFRLMPEPSATRIPVAHAVEGVSKHLVLYSTLNAEV